MADMIYPQSAEPNEFRYFSFAWLIEIAPGLTAGAEKHPGETWHDIPAKEHAARAVRHLSMWLAGDRSDKHIINASMRCMMAWVMDQEESKKMREIKFRVWDTFWETMYPVQKIHLENNKASAYCYTDWGGESCLVEGVGSIMQYTGVNDIGGEEIYERDILRDKFGEYYLAKLVDGEFVAEADGEMYDLEDVAGIAGIISNIYENPELVSK